MPAGQGRLLQGLPVRLLRHSRPMRTALALTVYITAFALGLLVIIANAFPVLYDQAPIFLHSTAGYLTTSGVAAIFLLTPVALLLRWLRARRRSREISYTTELGRIAVSLIAIEEALTRAIEGEPEVKKATVRVFEDRMKRAVVIEAVVTLWEVANVTERNRFCQKLLRRRFAELMPEQTAVQVQLSIHRLNQRRVEQLPAVKPEVSAPATGLAAPAPPRQLKLERLPTPEVGGVELPTGDDDLYVGPAYPVSKDDDEDSNLFVPKPVAPPAPTTERTRRR